MSEAMNYKLPPMPTFEEWCRIISPSEPGTQIASVENFVKAYAIAAIEAQGVQEELRNALQQIADWNSHSLQLAVEHGAVGVRDFYRQIALDALASAPPAPQAKPQP